jgi:hypothetical protein
MPKTILIVDDSSSLRTVVKIWRWQARRLRRARGR